MQLNRVLVVSPSAAFLHAATGMLKSHSRGIELKTALTTLEAVELMTHWTPQVVFLDGWIPGTNTAWAVQKLRTQQPTAHIVLMTMDDSVLYHRARMTLGADRVINKQNFMTEVQAFFANRLEDRRYAETVSRWL